MTVAVPSGTVIFRFVVRTSDEHLFPMSPIPQNRYYQAVRHIVTHGSRGPRHRTIKELTLIRMNGKPCLPNGIDVRLPKRQFRAFKRKCPHNGMSMRFADATVMHDTVGNWRLVSETSAPLDGALHLFDLYPPKDIDVISIDGTFPVRKPIADAFKSDGDIPVFFKEFGRGSCLIAPVRFGFTAIVRLNGTSGADFQINALTEQISAKKTQEGKMSGINVVCGKDAMRWLLPEPVAA